MIDEALEKLGVDQAIVVVHSLAGALGALMALDYPQRFAGTGHAGGCHSSLARWRWHL